MAENTQEKIEAIQQQTARIEEQTRHISTIDKKSADAEKQAYKAKFKADNNRQTIKRIWGLLSAIIVAIITVFIKTL